MLLFPSILLALTNPASAGSSDKVAVCHWSGTTFSEINVSASALSAHTTNHASSWGAYDHVAGVFYADLDGDGFGNAASGTSTCQQEGYVADNTDTDDGDPSVSPDQTEVCDDSIDNNCDGEEEACVSACPCFDAADIEAARQQWEAATWAYRSYSDCSTTSWAALGREKWQLEFVGQRDSSSSGYWVRQFLATAVPAESGSSSCMIGTGPGPAITRLTISQSEAESCGALVLEAASDLAMTCNEYVY